MGRKCRTCPRHYLTPESRTYSVDQEILFSESALLATGVWNKGCYFPPFLCMFSVQNVYVATAIELKPNEFIFPYVLYSHAILNSLHPKNSHEILEITAVYKPTSQPFFIFISTNLLD